MVPFFLIFFEYKWIKFIKKQCFGGFIINLLSTIKRCPMLSFCEILSRILLNSSKLGGCSCFLIQPYGNGFVMEWPYWLLSSIFSIFVDILFVCFLPSMFKSNNTFSILLSSSKISVSKASRVFTQLKPPINVFVINVNELAELHLQGLYLNSFCR